MSQLDNETVTRAVVAWTGWGTSSTPDRQDARLVSIFGESVGLDLVQRVHQLEDDFYESDARLTVPDTKGMGERRSLTSASATRSWVSTRPRRWAGATPLTTSECVGPRS